MPKLMVSTSKITLAMAALCHPVNVAGFSSMRNLYCPSDDKNIGFIVTSSSGKTECVKQSRSEAEQDCLKFLQDNIMPFDIPIADSLGFPNTEKNVHFEEEQVVEVLGNNLVTTDLPDGLDNGIVQQSIQMTLDTKTDYYWTRDIPKDIFLEYVLPFVNVDEARNNWRPIMKEALNPTLQNLLMMRKRLSVEEVVEAVNQSLWTAFKNINDGKKIEFRSGQTPLIYDPMSVILHGYASCTGLSIMFVDALRTSGIPARLAGTPAWNGKMENGNHSWVEFYSVSKGEWIFLEPMTKGIPYDPCSYWFCNKSHFDGNTLVFAARYKRPAGENYIHFPMQWDRHNTYVVGEERSAIMTEICSKC